MTAHSFMSKSPSLMPPLPSQQEVDLNLNKEEPEVEEEDEKYQELNTPSDAEEVTEIYVVSKVKSPSSKKKESTEYNAVPLKGSSEDEDEEEIEQEDERGGGTVENVLLDDLVTIMMSDEDESFAE